MTETNLTPIKKLALPDEREVIAQLPKALKKPVKNQELLVETKLIKAPREEVLELEEVKDVLVPDTKASNQKKSSLQNTPVVAQTNQINKAEHA